MKTAKLTVFQAVVLSVFGALALGAVGIFAFLTSTGGGNQIGVVRMWGTLDGSAISSVLKTLADEDTRLGQVTYEQKDSATYESDLANALASGTGPDIFLMRENATEIDGGKAMIIPLSALSARDFETTFADASSVYMTENGALAVPFMIDPLVLYWNRDMLAAAGYSQAPQYWDEFYDIANKVSARDDSNSITRSAVALGEYENVDNAKEILSALIMQAGGAITAEDNQGKIFSALGGRGSGTSTPQLSTESALRFYTEFSNPSKSDYSWNRSLPTASDSFSAGNLALYAGLASEATQILKKNPNLQYGIATFPQVRGQQAGKLRFVDSGHMYALAISKNSKNPQGALTVAFLLAGVSTEGALSDVLQLAPARRDLLGKKTPDTSGLFKSQAIITRFWKDPDPDKTGDIFRDMIEGVTSGALRLSEAVGRADQQMGALLGIGS